MSQILQSFVDEFARYRLTAEKAVSQLNEDELNKIPGEGMNSVAMIMRHLSGNLRSRFTDFLESDGEKPWRDREQEFSRGPFSEEELLTSWESGLRVLEETLGKLDDNDLAKVVRIRGISLSVSEALARSLAHFSYHVGQIVLLARLLKCGDWKWISIPPGKSQDYNLRPDKEKKPSP